MTHVSELNLKEARLLESLETLLDDQPSLGSVIDEHERGYLLMLSEDGQRFVGLVKTKNYADDPRKFFTFGLEEEDIGTRIGGFLHTHTHMGDVYPSGVDLDNFPYFESCPLFMGVVYNVVRRLYSVYYYEPDEGVLDIHAEFRGSK